MTVLTTVLIAIAAALIGFGFGVAGFDYVDTTVDDDLKNPPFTIISKPVVTTIIMPKSIGHDAFTKRVNKALKDTIIKAFSVNMIPYNDETVDRMFVKWRALLPCLEYDEYRPQFQRLDILCRTCEVFTNPNNLHFDAVWSKKPSKPSKSDCIGYARGHQ